jgi:hypothetical protein
LNTGSKGPVKRIYDEMRGRSTITPIAAAIGGYVASEYLGPASAWGPQYDGMAPLPALIGAAQMAAPAELSVRSIGQPTV